jgi:hypothetical protein
LSLALLRNVPIEAPPSGSPVFDFLNTKQALPVVGAFTFLEFLGLSPAWVAELLKVTPTIVSAWRLGRKKVPGDIRVVLAAAGTWRLQMIENFWTSEPSFIESVCKHAEVSLPIGWRRKVKLALQRGLELEAEVYADNSEITPNVERAAMDRMERIGLLKPEGAAMLRALIDEGERKARAIAVTNVKNQQRKLD